VDVDGVVAAADGQVPHVVEDTADRGCGDSTIETDLTEIKWFAHNIISDQPDPSRVLIADRRRGTDAIGDVADSGNENGAMLVRHRAEADLDRELRSVATAPRQVKVGAREPNLRLDPIAVRCAAWI
jgi:hypothetical protein